MSKFFKQSKAFYINRNHGGDVYFSAVMIIASSSLANGFLTGRLHSTSTQEANRSLNLVMDNIWSENGECQYESTGVGARQCLRI